MRVLLLGATGSLGSRCLPALIAHKHTVTVFVRNIPKLQSMMTPALLERVHAIVEGDATDAAALKQALLDHDIEGILDVAGNIVLPWKDWVLPNIAAAVTEAAVAVGKQRGKPLRAWVTSALMIMKYPGTNYLIEDYAPKVPMDQHQATRDVVEAIPIQDLKWSILAVAQMSPADRNHKRGPFKLLDNLQTHDLLLGATSPPGWEKTWLGSIPFFGPYLNLIYLGIVVYRTKYEAVADFLAEDLEKEDSRWIGKKVAVKEKSKKDV